MPLTRYYHCHGNNGTENNVLKNEEEPHFRSRADVIAENTRSKTNDGAVRHHSQHTIAQKYRVPHPDTQSAVSAQKPQRERE